MHQVFCEMGNLASGHETRHVHRYQRHEFHRRPSQWHQGLQAKCLRLQRDNFASKGKILTCKRLLYSFIPVIIIPCCNAVLIDGRLCLPMTRLENTSGTSFSTSS